MTNGNGCEISTIAGTRGSGDVVSYGGADLQPHEPRDAHINVERLVA